VRREDLDIVWNEGNKHFGNSPFIVTINEKMGPANATADALLCNQRDNGGFTHAWITDSQKKH